MPTGPEEERPVQPDGLESFLSAVRGMVHGDHMPVDQVSLAPSSEADGETVPTPPEEPTGGPAWLPGTWVVEEPPVRRGRRRAGGPDDSLTRHERKVLEAQRQDARKRRRKASARRLPRIPAQPDTPFDKRSFVGEPAGEQVGDSARRKRRERRRDATRAQRIPDPLEDAESVSDLVGNSVTTTPTRGSRRGTRRERRRVSTQSVGAGAAEVESSETDTVSGSMSETASMSEVDEAEVARPAAEAAGQAAKLERRDELHGRRPEKHAARAEASAPVGSSRRARRRERRREAALQRALAKAAEGLPPSEDPEREDETLAEHLARVEAPILPRRSRRARSRVPAGVRRTANVTAVVVLVAGAAVLPWAVPEVRSLIADAVPGGDSTVVPVEDPPVEPPEATPGTAPVEQGNRYDGVRLESAGTPREVVVPRLHVDSDVVPISGQSGELLPPSDPQILGWWREGRPIGAAEGSAVITGHTVHTGGGALDHLDKLVVGDSLRVRTDRGWIRYVVQRARIYPTAELARDAEEIFRLDGPGRLVVITCDDWNGEFYESNAVVFAVPVDDEPF